MDGVELPNKALERRLRRAIMESLHVLLPEFRAHIAHCPACGRFHEWVRWAHQRNTNYWIAGCPETGAALKIPFLFGQPRDVGEPTDVD